MTNRLITCILAMLCTLFASAQGIVSFTSDTGLSNTCIHSIAEDSYHNVWITTRNGLNMYDGAKMRTYFHDEKDSTSLTSDIVTSVVELKEGKLLVGTDAGLCMFDYSTDCFYPITLINEEGERVTPRIVDIVKRKDGTALIMPTGKASYLVSDTSDGVKAEINMDYVIANLGATRYVEARDGKQWMVSSGYAVGYYSNGKMHQVEVEGRVLHLVEGVRGSIYADIEGKGLFRYDEQTGTFVSLALPELEHTTIKKLRSNGEGYIFVCTDGNGLFLYNENTGKLELSGIRTTEYNIAQANIEDAMQDVSGNLWIGVYWKGVIMHPRMTSAFDYVGRRSALKNSIGTNCVTAIHPAADRGIWVGTDHCGLYHLNPDGMQSKHYDPAQVSGVPETITAIYQDKEGTLWLGSSIGGMVCMNPSTGIFKPFGQIEPKGDEVRKVYSIQPDKNGNLWIATMGEGLFCYNPSTRKLDHYTGRVAGKPLTPYTILWNVWTNCIAVDGDRIFLGHSSGLDYLHIKEDGMLEHAGYYLYTSVNDLVLDKKGELWAATAKGLCKMTFEGEEPTIERLTREDGLSCDMTRSLELNYQPNGEYEVWASTDNGLNCYTPSTKAFRTFYIGDGLQGNEFTEHCSAIIDDRLVFGGVNGLNIFKPSEVMQASDLLAPQLRVVGLYLQGEVVKAGQQSGSYTIYQSWLNEATELNFCHIDNNIALELSTLGFSQNAVYEYSLDGKNWMNLGNGQNRVVLTNLDVGTYKLRFRVTVNGKMSDERLLTIKVHAPWYGSVWMRLLYLLIVLGLAYLIYIYVRTRIREKRLLVEKKQEEEIAEARIQFFMNISHEIRTPMTLILAPLEKLRSMGDDSEHNRHYNLIYQNAQRILQLINQMMDVRKIEKGQFQLDYQRIEMVGFIRNLYELFETTAQRHNISLSYLHDMEKLEVQVDSPSIDKILMNLLSNSMKFTRDGGYVNIELTENVEKDTFTISVTDTGMGIPGNKYQVFKRFYSGVHQNGYIGTGIGLNLTYLLVQLHEGEIRVMDNPNERGTRFEVELPCRRPDDEVTERPESVLEITENKSSGKRHRNLLLVEDDDDIRQYLHSELSSDFSVTESANGQEAWDLVLRQPEKVDVIITDIMMPLMNGDELCQKVKSNFNTNHIPVIILSAKNSDADRIAGMSIGADAYMTKPFNVELLRATTLTILQNHQSLQQRAVADQKTEESIEKVELVSPDEQLMNRIMKCINENMSNPDLSVEFVADQVGVSRVHFHRKLKEIAGQTPREFIRAIRMKQAARLLREKRLDITDVSIATGFRSLSTFSTTFRQIYGQTPTEYMNQKKKE